MRAVAAVTLAGVVLVAVLVAIGVRRDDASADRGRAPFVPAAEVDRFDAGAAWTLMLRQVAAGQRPAGSPQLRRIARVLRDRLPHGHFERLPGQRGLRNVIGTVPGRGPGIVIGAHYDTLAAPRGFVGANNGAAGSAIVVRLAHTLARAHRPAGAQRITFVLFDGEEPATGTPEDTGDFYHAGLRGSRAYVRAHPRRPGAMILLDYVAGRGLRLPREGSSSPDLWSRLRAAARAVGVGAVFPPRTGLTIIDDHTPFLRAGVPAVDLIDWSYPGHSLADRPDHLSLRSMDAVGETVLELVRREDRGA